MSKTYGQSTFGNSMSGFSQFGTSTISGATGANIKFLNNERQNKLEQIESQKAYMANKKKKEIEAYLKREEKKKQKPQHQDIGTAKKNKIKKMKNKYADQDDEEREMRLALLGAKPMKGFDITAHKKRGENFKDKNQETPTAVEE